VQLSRLRVLYFGHMKENFHETKNTFLEIYLDKNYYEHYVKYLL
jgi:hypothetical protein